MSISKMSMINHS